MSEPGLVLGRKLKEAPPGRNAPGDHLATGTPHHVDLSLLRATGRDREDGEHSLMCLGGMTGW